MTPPPLGGLLARLREEPSRTGSVIISLYGDAIVPRGGSVWLGTLLVFFRAMGVADGVVRTAASRLAADGWLARSRTGRNSFYALAPKGQGVFAAAAAHIYGPPPDAWGGFFQVAMLGPDAVRADWEARGFGMAAPGVMIAPDTACSPQAEAGTLMLTASTTPAAARLLAARVWPLDRLAESYERLLAMFGAAEAASQAASRLRGIEALLLRVLVVHVYRRVVLRDPRLPPDLLPPDWPGDAARTLCGALHRAVYAEAEAWLDAHAVNEAGPLPPAPVRQFAVSRDHA